MPVTWPTLRTWVDGDPVRPADFNRVGDAENYLFRLQRYQTADQTVTVNTTINDLSMQDVLFVSGDVWIFKACILYTCVAGANGIQVQVYGGPNAQTTAAIGHVAADRTTPATFRMLAGDDITTAIVFEGPSSTTGRMLQIRGLTVVIITTATLGINFSPFSAGNNATILKGSWLIAERVVKA